MLNAAFVARWICIFLFAEESLVFSCKIFAQKQNHLFHLVISLCSSFLFAWLAVKVPVAAFYVLIFLWVTGVYLLLWRGEWQGQLFLAAAYLLNIMAVRSVVLGCFVLIRQTSSAEILVWEKDVIFSTMNLSCLILCLMLRLAIRLLPVKKIRQVAEHGSLRRGMIGSMTFWNFFLLVQNYLALSIGKYTLQQAVSLILSSIVVFSAGWSFLFYNFRIISLLGLEEQVETLSRAVNQDGMTGLLNKSAAILRINDAIRQGGALFVIDVDDFKRVNDLFGHNEGDIQLQRLAAVLQSVFGREDILGRFGGDEFIAFQPLSSEEENGSFYEQVCGKCREMVEKSRLGTGHVTISIGAAIISPDPENDFVKGFVEADRVLYEAKKKGKNSYVVVETSEKVAIL